MKIGIIHLTDIHLKSSQDFIFQKVECLANSCRELVNSVQNLFIVVTGDVIDCGKVQNYQYAKNLFRDVEKSLIKENPLISKAEFIIVPGNHDCNFDNVSPFRDLVLKSIVETGTVQKEEWMTAALSVQTDFQNFNSSMNSRTNGNKQCMSYEIDYEYDEETSITFHCYNTALASTIDEQPQSLIIPTSSFINRKENTNSIVVSIFHHNTGWLSTRTHDNNRKMFEEHLAHHSDIVLCGHEHQSQHKIESCIDDNSSLVYIEGGALQNNGKSSFSFLWIDTSELKYCVYDFKYDAESNIYSKHESEIRDLHTNKIGISYNKTHEEYLNRIDLPLSHPNKKNLLLEDIFVYPSLTKRDISTDLSLEPAYIDSSILSQIPHNSSTIVLEGDVQSGKTSLLKYITLQISKKGLFPIWTSGKDWKEVRLNVINDILRKKYKEQFDTANDTFDKYSQQEKSKKAIIIDNIDNSPLNHIGVIELIKELNKNYGLIIISTSPMLDFRTGLQGDGSTDYYRIMPFGHHLQYKLVEKWKSIGINEYLVNVEELHRDIKLTYDQVSLLLGNQLMPAYPVFLLTLLQGIELAKNNISTEETGYGYCYNTVLMISLLKNGVTKDSLLGFLNLLECLAYSLYNHEIGLRNTFNRKEFETFYNKYKVKFNFSYSLDETLNILVSSCIIREQDELYIFGYKYVYFFLVAKHISKFDDKKRNTTIKHLCENIIDEKNANILIFLVYHKSDSALIEELVFTGLLPFCDDSPLTLDTSDEAFAPLNHLVKQIKPLDILYDNVDYKEHQQESLKRQDSAEQSIDDANSERISPSDVVESDEIKDFKKTTIAIKILGQIVKNHRDTLEKDRLIELITESYLVGFRALAHIGKMLQDAIPDLIKLATERFGYSDTDKQFIETKVRLFFCSLLYNACLGIFTQLAMNVGTSKINHIYDDVAKRINSPAAKLVSFTISSYYGTLNESELKSLVLEFEKNPVALQIVKARVANYVYNNYLTYNKKQRIGSICNMKLINLPKH